MNCGKFSKTLKDPERCLKDKHLYPNMFCSYANVLSELKYNDFYQGVLFNCFAM